MTDVDQDYGDDDVNLIDDAPAADDGDDTEPAPTAAPDKPKQPFTLPGLN